MTPTQYKQTLSKIVKYLEAQGYTVKLNSNSFGLYEEESLITCSTRSRGTLEFLCSLLHEAGHTQQSQSQFINLRKSLRRDRAIIIEQEYSAWVHGWKVAEELKIATPELTSTYNTLWLKYWSQYIEYITTKCSKTDIRTIAAPYIEI